MRAKDGAHASACRGLSVDPFGPVSHASAVQKISAPHSTLVKRVLPFATMAAVSAWTYSSHRGEQYALELALLWFVVGSIALWVLLRRGFWRLADTVEDQGDRLVITRWKTRIEVPIANVKALRRNPALNGSNVTLFLSAPSALGSEISFLAPGRRTMRDIEDKLEALASRIAKRDARQ
jgi:hypothetical protein